MGRMGEGQPIDMVRLAATGDQAAIERLFSHLYGELRVIAERLVRADHGSLQPTLLVHEAYLKLVGSSRIDWRTATHVRALAARAMRQIIVDDARERGRGKRGGGWRRVSLQGLDGEDDVLTEVPIVQVNDALTELAALDERAARVVVYRFFGGLTDEEIGAQLGVTDRTVRNDWRMARAWLRSRLRSIESETP